MVNMSVDLGSGSRDAPAWQARSSSAHFSQTFPFAQTLLPWRRRLGERRRHLSRLRQALCRRRASSRYAAPSLSFRCARRSTPNPNKTICIRIRIQLQYMSYAGSAPALVASMLLSNDFPARSIIWHGIWIMLHVSLGTAS